MRWEALGELPNDIGWRTIVSLIDEETTTHFIQRLLGELKRIIRMSSVRGDVVLDYFAGQGTTDAAAPEL